MICATPRSDLTASQKGNPLCRNAMLTTPHYLATQAGLFTLRRGGNAVEAAISAAAVLTVVYPQMCTLGGDSFWLVYNAHTGELKGLNASGRSGEKVSRELYAQAGRTSIPGRGPLAAITVPGLVSGWQEMHAWSTAAMGGTFSVAQLLEDALLYAEEGFPVSSGLAAWLARDTDTRDKEDRFLQRFEGFAKALYAAGRPLLEGEILRQPDLAKSLRFLADEGLGSFYEGSLADQLVQGLQAVGGVLTGQDFRSHHADWVEPLAIPYAGYTACNLPPNTQGISSLQILGIADACRLTERFAEGSADYYHILVEATKIAFAMRERWVTDPDFCQAPLDRMLDPAAFQTWAQAIDPAKAGNPGLLLDPKGDTIWLGVVDAQGNAVSMIQSVYNDFGSGILPAGTGILLQNRGCFFSLDPKHVNTLEPGKRTMHTLNPPMILKDGKPLLVYGTMGGEGQPQTQAALVTRILQYGMSPQEAIDAPRWLYGRSWGAQSNSLKLEARIPQSIGNDLKTRGHDVEYVPAYTDLMGHAGAILINREHGTLQGGHDPRGDGLALGF